MVLLFQSFRCLAKKKKTFFESNGEKDVLYLDLALFFFLDMFVSGCLTQDNNKYVFSFK